MGRLEKCAEVARRIWAQLGEFEKFEKSNDSRKPVNISLPDFYPSNCRFSCLSQLWFSLQVLTMARVDTL